MDLAKPSPISPASTRVRFAFAAISLALNLAATLLFVLAFALRTPLGAHDPTRLTLLVWIGVLLLGLFQVVDAATNTFLRAVAPATGSREAWHPVSIIHVRWLGVALALFGCAAQPLSLRLGFSLPIFLTVAVKLSPIAWRWMIATRGTAAERAFAISSVQHALAISGIGFTIVLALWQFLLPGYRTVHWDAEQYYYPNLGYLADALHAGFMPLWNPYQAAGYPFYADPQTLVYFPPFTLIALLIGYSLRVFQWQLLGLFWCAGIGFYVYSYRLFRSRTVAFILGTSYALSGIFIANAEHTSFINGYAWLPVLFLAFDWLLEVPGWQRGVVAGAVAGMIALGCYPGVLATMLLWLAVYCVGRLILQYQAKRPPTLHPFVMAFGSAGLMMVALALVQYVPALTVIKQSTRASVSLEFATGSQSFLPRNLITAVVPQAASLGTDAFFGADISMVNLYMGLLCLVGLAVALQHERSKLFLLHAVLALIAVATMFGSTMFVRPLQYAFLPLFNTFRHPSVTRGLVIFFALLGSGFGLTPLLQNSGILGQAARLSAVKFSRGMCAVLAVLSGLAVVLAWLSPAVQTARVAVWADALLVTALLWGIAYFTLRRTRDGLLSPLLLALALCALTSVDMAQAAYSNQGVIGDTEHWLERQRWDEPHNFTLPNKLDRVAGSDLASLNEATNYHYFEVGDHNPLALTRYKQLQAAIGTTPALGRLLGIGAQPDPLPRFHWVRDILWTAPDQALERMKQPDFDPATTVVLESPEVALNAAGSHLEAGHIELVQYLPNSMRLSVDNPGYPILNINDVYYPGWIARLDGRIVPIYRANSTFRGVAVPMGTHELNLTFEPRDFFIPAWIGLAAALAAIAVLALFADNRLTE